MSIFGLFKRNTNIIKKLTKAIAIPLIIKRITIFLCLLERWKGKAFPGACAPPHKGRGRGPLAGRSRSGRARQWEGPEGAKRPESPGNAFPSTVYSSIHKKESDLSQLDFLVTLSAGSLCKGRKFLRGVQVFARLRYYGSRSNCFISPMMSSLMLRSMAALWARPSSVFSKARMMSSAKSSVR